MLGLLKSLSTEVNGTRPGQDFQTRYWSPNKVCQRTDWILWRFWCRFSDDDWSLSRRRTAPRSPQGTSKSARLSSRHKTRLQLLFGCVLETPHKLRCNFSLLHAKTSAVKFGSLSKFEILLARCGKMSNVKQTETEVTE